MDVSERIDLLLTKKKISRRKLAIISGIPTSTFQSAMQRKGSMTIEMVERLAKQLDCSPAWLCGWNDKEETKQ